MSDHIKCDIISNKTDKLGALRRTKNNANAVLCVSLKHGCRNIYWTPMPLYPCSEWCELTETSGAATKVKVEVSQCLLPTDGVIPDMSQWRKGSVPGHWIARCEFTSILLKWSQEADNELWGCHESTNWNAVCEPHGDIINAMTVFDRLHLLLCGQYYSSGVDSGELHQIQTLDHHWPEKGARHEYEAFMEGEGIIEDCWKTSEKDNREKTIK